MNKINKTVLEMKNICKSFGPIDVLNDVHMVLHKGEVLGLIGENGAGKSTLIKILSGIHKKDRGDIILNGQKTEIKNAAHAQELGVSTIYQELSLIPDLNAVQNIFLNRECTSMGKSLVMPLSYNEMRERSIEILENELNIKIDVDKPLRYLTLAQKQMVEIARTVYANVQIIIMDEPTAALETAERKQLFKVIQKLRSKGHSIIFISHYLDEIMEICDTVNVLRDGKRISEGPVAEFSVERIILDMVGKSLKNQYPKVQTQIGENILEIKGLEKKGKFKDISFELRRGEILGIVGVEGCGKNEVVRSIFGALKYDSGKIAIRGKEVTLKNVKDAMDKKIAFVPAERKIDGLFLKQNIAWNTTIASLFKITRYKTIVERQEREITNYYIKQLRTKAKGYNQNISALSGGNQQKVMLSRWIMTDADIFLLEEPTRGIDVNAKTEVYAAIGACVKDGKGIIVVSSEEEEVLGICDRIIVMKKGRISKLLEASKTTVAEIKKYSVSNVEE